MSRVRFDFYQCKHTPRGTRLKIEFQISEEQARRIYESDNTSDEINAVVREVFAEVKP